MVYRLAGKATLPQIRVVRIEPLEGKIQRRVDDHLAAGRPGLGLLCFGRGHRLLARDPVPVGEDQGRAPDVLGPGRVEVFEPADQVDEVALNE